MTKTQVLVLGATGRIGGVLRSFWPAGAFPSPVTWQARRIGAGPDFKVFDPISEPAEFARAVRGRTVLCLAGPVPGRGEGDPEDHVRLAEVAIRAAGEGGGGPVLLASSAAVYGAAGGVLDEGVPLRPLSDYGRAKARMEEVAARLADQIGVRVTSLRIGNVAGCDAILGGWRPGFMLDRFADGRTPRRSYVGPASLARILGDLVARRDLPPALNVALPGVVEMGALLDAAGLEWTPRPAPDSAIEVVELSTRALGTFTRLDPSANLPATLVREWQDWQA
ncbi:NAD-dependent epimerase/dehydratase family protein [Lutimaribacter marinistellae]|uniref:NAD-dependent epimerase/dehydratase family protein n=1 Tax=Lutimaribacter marinistellae TaxID=1820329 RepID=A0ABV7TAI3_9RHOB